MIDHPYPLAVYPVADLAAAEAADRRPLHAADSCQDQFHGDAPTGRVVVARRQSSSSVCAIKLR